jgi:ferredoxin/flavodoxin---NADP+ reductase
MGKVGSSESSSLPEYDVVIVGGGPAGITAAIRCMNHHLSVLLVEGRKLGGQLIQLYPTKFIYDYSSYPEIRAGYLADRMVHHAKYKNVPMKEDTPVESIVKEGKMLRISTPSGELITKTVILAIGMGLFEPRKLGVPGEKEFENKGVTYAVPNMDMYRGQTVLVVGGGDSAVENAIGLSSVSKVIMIHRRGSLRAIESNLEVLENSLVEVRTNTELKEIHGEDRLSKVTLYNNEDNKSYELDVNLVVINIGFSPDLSLVDKAGVENDGNHIIIDKANMNTNISGIFACGDIVEYSGKARQILPALGEGVTAAEEAYNYIKSPYWVKESGGEVLIDKEKCISCGACMSICPNVFQRDNTGKSEICEDANLMLPCVDTALEACPTQAISLN